MKNFQNQILKQEILSEKMSEQNSEIENFQDKLFDCYVCWQKLDQYTLEVHFACKYNNFWNDNSNKCDICNNCFENNISLSLRHMKTRNWRVFFVPVKHLRGGHSSIWNEILIISLNLDLNFSAWLLNNKSWKSRLFRQFFFHVWHNFSSLKISSNSSAKTRTLGQLGLARNSWFKSFWISGVTDSKMLVLNQYKIWLSNLDICRLVFNFHKLKSNIWQTFVLKYLSNIQIFIE